MSVDRSVDTDSVSHQHHERGESPCRTLAPQEISFIGDRVSARMRRARSAGSTDSVSPIPENPPQPLGCTAGMDGSVTLIERERHLTGFDQILRESARRNGRALLLDGPCGSGKTELLAAFSRKAVTSGFTVLSAACSQAEQALPFGVISQIFRSLDLPQSLVDRVTRLLAEGAPLATQARSDTDLLRLEMVKVFHGLAVTLMDITAGEPLLLTVDDLQYADTPSLYALLHLLRRLRTARMAAVITDDPSVAATRPAVRVELLRQPHLRRMAVELLSVGGVHKLLTASRGRRPASSLAAGLHELSGGNPLLLRALLDDYERHDAVRTDGYGMALLTCLHRGTPILLGVARALAVLDEHALVAELAKLIDANVDDVEQALVELNTAGLLAGKRFRHTAARTAILDDLQSEERIELHRRAAHLRYDGGARATTVAPHLLEAGELAGWAVQILVEAAEHATLASEPELALSYLELAYRSCTDERERATIRTRAADMEWQVDPSTAIRHLPALTAAMRAGQLDGTRQAVLARQLLWHGRAEEATSALTSVRMAAQQTEDKDMVADTANVESWLRCTYPTQARRRQPSVTMPDQGDSSFLHGTDSWLHSTGLLADALTRNRTGTAADCAEHMLRATHIRRDTGWAEEGTFLALSTLLYTGRPQLAAELTGELNGQFAGRRLSAPTALLTAIRAETELWFGHLADARSTAESALFCMNEKSWGAAIGLPLGTLTLAATRTGDLDKASEYLSRPYPGNMLKTRYGLHYLHARGNYYLASQHSHAALADFLACGEMMRGWGLDLAGLVPWRVNAAEAWSRLGNTDRARQLLHDQLSRPDTDAFRTRSLALRTLATCSPRDRRLPLLSEALEAAETCGDEFEQARILADLSSAHRALDDNRRARMVIRRALHMAKLCGAAPLVTKLLAINDGVGFLGEDDEADSLSDSERRVASLAAMGYTNREIAAKLYVTASTVEQHLTRIYRKLKIKGRKHLPASMTTPQGNRPG